MKRIHLVLAIVFVAAYPAFAQQGPMPERYNPGHVDPDRNGSNGPTAAPQRPQADPRAAAQERFAAWQNAKRECFAMAGLKEGVHFRLKQGDGQTFRINDKVWLDPRFNHAAILKCQ